MANGPELQFREHFIILEFYVYKSKFFSFSEIPAPAAVRAVLSFRHVWPRGTAHGGSGAKNFFSSVYLDHDALENPPEIAWCV